jgi:hypothetical protein
MAIARILAVSLVALMAAPMLLPVGRSLAGGTLDQSQTNLTTIGGASPGGPSLLAGQSFTAGLTGALDQVTLAIAQQGSGGNFNVQIRPVDGGGLPTATVLGSGSVPLSTVPPDTGSVPPTLTTIPLTAPARVVAGAQYAIVFYGDDAWRAAFDNSNPYAGGKALQDIGAGWSTTAAVDAGFQTFVVRATLSVAGGSVAEGNGGTSSLTLPVFQTVALAVDATVPYTLLDGTATGGTACGPDVDFINTGGVATIKAGSVVGSITVPICEDAQFEPDEGLRVALGAPTNAVLGTGQAIGTILNDDLAPTSTPLPAGATATPVPVRVSAQRAGNGRMLVTISASGSIERVSWPTVENVAVETADGTPTTGGSLAPPQGSTTAVFYVRKTGGSSAMLPLTVTGAFPTWQTFVGGGPNAW